MSNEPVTSNRATFRPSFRPELVCNISDVLANISDDKAQVIDARSGDRFFAKVPEPRQGLRSGHIPNSINLPFNSLLDGDSKELLPAEKLLEKFIKVLSR